MSSWKTLLVACAFVAACSSSPAGKDDFCNALVSNCNSVRKTCDDLLKADALEYPSCVMARDAFLGCLSKQNLACPDSDTVYAGAGKSNGKEYTLHGFTAYVGAACSSLGDTWQACVQCGKAIGFGTSSPGIGDPCTSSCATGLECKNGACTKSCSTDDDCMGKTYADSSCGNSSKTRNVCVYDDGNMQPKSSATCQPRSINNGSADCVGPDVCARYPGRKCVLWSSWRQTVNESICGP